MGKSRGRRSSYDEETHCVLVENHARNGLTQVEISEALGISYHTWRNWIEKHPEFYQAWKRGCIPLKAELENKMVEIAMDDKNKNQFNALKFILERRFSQDWMERVENIEKREITPEMIAEFEKSLLR